MSKIIFIEHNAAIESKFLKTLQDAGFSVEVVHDGVEGFEKIKNEKPDLVLVDADVPRKNGEQILESIRTDFDLAFIPVVVLTSEVNVKESQKYTDLGACDIMQREGTSPEDLMAKVQKCFNLGGGALDTNHKKTPTENFSSNNNDKVKGTKVVIIEDDQFLSELCQTKLSKEGYVAITALDGESGVEKVVQEKPEIVLLDILLPGIDGFEVLKRIKSNPDPEIKNIPVLLLSNYGQESKIQKGMSLGAVDYLVKANFTTNEIVNKIKSVIGTQKK